MWAVLKQAPLVHLAGRAQWRPLAFLAQQLPLPGKAMNLQAAEARACEWVKQLDADLAREIQAASVQVGWWSVRFASDRSRHPNKRALLEANALLIVDGLRLARRVGSLVRGFLCAHLELGVPLPKATLMHLVHGVMLLKTVEASPRDRAASSPPRTAAPHALEPATPPPGPPSTPIPPPPRPGLLPRATRLGGLHGASRRARLPPPPAQAAAALQAAPRVCTQARRRSLRPCSPLHPACSPMHPACGPSTQASAPMSTVPTLPPQCVPGSTTRLSTGWRR